ncbi:PREDICTED: caffeic acid 3-O-methyltransferase-like [Tarenaya hassleriana]|uniref:caffeic acid 3-O-methyltransferase-like n=1 Tax=Tarenaya hassleriana TaxID=28532 RepID=UPI00053C8E63|nr:PREDICTED: caffeic acid 3-O-methyltransferase-like [Tarenaya hassleriana]
MPLSLKETQTKPMRHEEEDEETFANAMQMALGSVFPMTMKAAAELGLFEILATAAPGGDAELSAAEIADQLSNCTNPEAPKMVERILRLLVSHGVIRCRVSDKGDKLYGLTPVAKFFAPNEEGFSLSPLMLLAQDIVFLQNWRHLQEAVLKGGIAFNMSHGMYVFQYPSTDQKFNELFNTAMFHHTSIVLNKVLETYKGFDQVNSLVDVGGGVGITLDMIVNKYPRMHGINFDLPQVIQHAPAYPGVEHVAGDMFESVPKGDAIFLKWIIHNWDDEHCVKLLKNCHQATPETGKVIVMEVVVPDVPETSLAAQDISHVDLQMMTQFPGGKERTRQELETLAAVSGFGGVRFVSSTRSFWIMEFFK